jgi:DNA-binding Lrp family transcriptional regulator
MKKLNPLDLKLLFELMKGAKTTDRKIAKTLGVSQPTVTRRRALLEKELIDGYTVVPKWSKIGYEILAVTLVKSPFKFGSNEERQSTYGKAMEWLAKQPNVIMGSGCRGMGMTGIMISLHKSYAELDEFLISHRRQLGDILEDVQTVIVNLSGKAYYRPLHLKYLAETRMEETS